jgi:RNA recognition motif-containing protein
MGLLYVFTAFSQVLYLTDAFQEFDTREAAEESVAKYHEGYFMGNKIRVELSRGGGKSAKYGDPGACFKCGQMGHWARFVNFFFLPFFNQPQFFDQGVS